MKKLLSAGVLALFAIILGSVVLVSAGDESKAAEVKPITWDGDPAHVNVMGFLCDMDKMDGVLTDDENTRICVVNAVAANDAARKLIMKKMLSNEGVRSMIMEKIATTPALRTQMEQKLAATK